MGGILRHLYIQYKRYGAELVTDGQSLLQAQFEVCLQQVPQPACEVSVHSVTARLKIV